MRVVLQTLSVLMLTASIAFGFGTINKVVDGNNFKFAAVGLAHSHIYGQTEGLEKAGAKCVFVYDDDPALVKQFQKKFPDAKAAKNVDEILSNPEIRVVTSADIPSHRADLGIKVMKSGKDFLTDKPPFTSLAQLEEAKKVCAKTGRKYIPLYGEHFSNPACEKAIELVKSGAIGQIVQIVGLAPHKLSKATRPNWFFERKEYGGIICDIASHQFELYLAIANVDGGTVEYASVGNFANPQTPQLQDFGEAALRLSNGVRCYLRVDWFSPDGLPTWGDGRLFILGTTGYIELRNNIDISRDGYPKQNLYICDSKGLRHIDCRKMPTPFYERFILDVLNRTETAITQSRAFKGAELALIAQAKAESGDKKSSN